MNKSVPILLIFTLVTFVSFAQPSSWIEKMHDPTANFYEIQEAAESYFSTHSTGKSSGWKPYKRWEYYHSLRVKPDGTLPLPAERLSAIADYEAQMSANKRSTVVGNWQELGPIGLPANGTGQPNGLGRIAAIAFHPVSANTIYAGTASGGIWQTNDNAATWTSISNGLTRLGVSSIVVHPVSPNTIYIGTGDRDGGDAPGYGVWYSTDGGATWAPRNNGMGNRTVYEIVMDPTDPNIMIAATNTRIYRTTDGGANWNLSFNGHNCKDIAFKPSDPNTIYASGTLLYRSTDNGQTFNQITLGVPNNSIRRIALGVSPNQPNWVYLLAAYNNIQGFEGVYRSTNSGTSFVQQSNSPNILGYDTNGGNGNQGWYDLVITCDQSNANILYTGGVNVWKSIDAGVNWVAQSHWYGAGGLSNVHADDHVLEWSPHSGDLYLGHDGGIHRSANGGATFTEISSGIAVAQVYKIGQSATQKDLCINGYQDNGTAFYRDGSWFTEIGGDGMECIVDYTDADVMYGALYYGDIRRSTNGGASFATVADNGFNGMNEGGGWVTPYKLHPTDPNTMLVGYDNVWLSNNIKDPIRGNIVWNTISNFGTTNNIVDLAIASSDPNVMYVSKGGTERFHRSSNAMSGAATWTNLHANLPVNSTPKDIEIHPTDPNNIWVALGNDIYESTNGGNTWTNFSGTLPNISLNTIVYDTASPVNALYVGMDVGVYYRDNNMADWVPFSGGLANVEVTELEIFYDDECGDDKLRAGTYGRGLWESDLMDPGTLAPIACFEAFPTTICEGAVVKFVDNSSYTPTGWNWTITPATFNFTNGTNATMASPEVQFNATGLYTVTLTATNANGPDSKVETNYIDVSGAALLIPIIEDLELGTACGTASNCGTTNCIMPGGWTNLANGTEDDIDWRLDAGGTDSGNTGPDIDANPGTAAGLYAYLEASSCSNATGILLSPCLDLRPNGSASLNFSLHMYGANMGSFHLDILHGGAWINDIMPVRSGDYGNTWNNVLVNLDAYTGSVVQLRFRGITGNGYASDMAIDNIHIESGVLATRLLAFDGLYLDAKGNQLSWQVESPQENDEFELVNILSNGEEKTLAILSGSEEETHEYIDTQPITGYNNYRLYIHGIDGSRVASEIVEIYTPFRGDWTRLYPNPFEETLTMEIFSEKAEASTLRILDLHGKVVMQKDVEIDAGISVHEINLDMLPSGLYFIHVKEEIHKMVKK